MSTGAPHHLLGVRRRPAIAEESSPFPRLVRDDVIIGLAFAQCLVDDRIEVEAKRRALVAIERQGLECVLAFRDWTDRQERQRNLEAMRRFLSAQAD